MCLYLEHFAGISGESGTEHISSRHLCAWVNGASHIRLYPKVKNLGFFQCPVTFRLLEDIHYASLEEASLIRRWKTKNRRRKYVLVWWPPDAFATPCSLFLHGALPPSRPADHVRSGKQRSQSLLTLEAKGFSCVTELIWHFSNHCNLYCHFSGKQDSYFVHPLMFVYLWQFTIGRFLLEKNHWRCQPLFKGGKNILMHPN